MRHSQILSFIVFITGFLTGIACLFEPLAYLKFAGATVIAYLAFLLVSEFEDRDEE